MNIVFIGIPLWYKKQFDLFLKNKSNCSSIFNNTNELLKINRKNFVRQVNVNRSSPKKIKNKQTLLVLLYNNNAYDVPTLRMPTLRINLQNSKLLTRAFIRLVKAVLTRPQKISTKTRKKNFSVKKLSVKTPNVTKTRRGNFNKKPRHNKKRFK